MSELPLWPLWLISGHVLFAGTLISLTSTSPLASCALADRVCSALVSDSSSNSVLSSGEWVELGAEVEVAMTSIGALVQMGSHHRQDNVPNNTR